MDSKKKAGARKGDEELGEASQAESLPNPLVEGEHYYWEGDLFVFTAKYLLARGYCCKSGCRHCPYGYTKGINKV